MSVTPVFIFSLPRSGSTLTQRVLTAHDGVASAAEPWVLLPLLQPLVPTAAVSGVRSAYWCRTGQRTSLRWVLPEQEEPLLDALARVSAADGLGVGRDTRFLGTFRAHGLLVPVWDLPADTEAAALEEPAARLRRRLDEELAAPRPLSGEERRARSGLFSRQLTLR